jgi:hypothetical protein
MVCVGESESSISHALAGDRWIGPALNDLDTSKMAQWFKVGLPDVVLECAEARKIKLANAW